MRKLSIAFLILGMLQFGTFPSIAQASSEKAADCSTYARNRAETEAPRGGGALGGAARGAAGGALFGAIVGGGKGAGRGAALGGGLGAVKGSRRSARDREANYQYYFDQCMRGNL